VLYEQQCKCVRGAAAVTAPIHFRYGHDVDDADSRATAHQHDAPMNATPGTNAPEYAGDQSNPFASLNRLNAGNRRGGVVRLLNSRREVFSVRCTSSEARGDYAPNWRR
jgi:hypothetical protein